MIDTASEQIITLAQAAAELPRRRRGRKCHVSTIYRWTVAGCRGVKLEFVQVGATRCTSRAALGRFFDRLTAGAVPQSDAGEVRTTDARRRANEKVDRELDALRV